MSNQAVANRYAVALFQLAKENNVLDTVENELQLVKQVVKATPDFMTVLMNPKVVASKKKELIRNSFGSNVSEIVFQTIFLLIDRKRIDILLPLIDKYKKLSLDALNIAEAKVYSAYELSEEEKNELSTVFARKIGKTKLVIENIVDKDLIGGIKLRIGDRIYDGSLQGQLDRLQRGLLQKR
ncbi:F0F1 ATP synthase subunit delta [Bacillus alkalicellulosilyticus]|uniref:F0F1 ATP synthase subunit delta n=1 Tax=Alkalihalobacterium alkalicellulosilyticum TaxID=1912214 RepID=UPI000996170C|nr:F0F1 ATP synthase subunit delta [Bacillus alkalicellulosilyticus]